VDEDGNGQRYHPGSGLGADLVSGPVTRQMADSKDRSRSRAVRGRGRGTEGGSERRGGRGVARVTGRGNGVGSRRGSRRDGGWGT
jgi:hypothetical protein